MRVKVRVKVRDVRASSHGQWALNLNLMDETVAVAGNSIIES